jgi:hypothetical protein
MGGVCAKTGISVEVRVFFFEKKNQYSVRLRIRHRAIGGAIRRWRTHKEKQVHHRDTEARRRKKKRYLFFTFFSVPLCLCGGSSLLAAGRAEFPDGQSIVSFYSQKEDLA